MFQSARIKLTAMYTLIIMLISVLFSMVVYRSLTEELSRLERVQRNVFERRQMPPPLPLDAFEQREIDVIKQLLLDPSLIREAKQRVLLNLIIINCVIAAASATGGYFLSGRTLQPIQKMMDAQKRFVSDASHELRTPLTSMRTELEVALLNDLSPNESKELIQSSVQEITHLQELVDNLLVLSNGEGEQIRKRFSDVMLLDVVDDALKKVVPKAKEKGITIENDVEDVAVHGDLTSLTQVMVILLDNAIKYSDNNSQVRIYTVVANHHSPLFEPRYVPKKGANNYSPVRENMVEIVVQDQGKGIAEKDLPHVFDRFYRADEARSKSSDGGYGLGLAIAKKLIHLHKGDIWIESTVYVGTRVHIQIPISSFSQ